MVLIKLKVKGGLGNQLSQVSFAYGILEKYNNASLIIDKSLFKKKKKRTLKFGKFIHKTNTFKFFLDELPVSKIYSYKNKFSITEKFVYLLHDLILVILKVFELSTRVLGINIKQNKILIRFFLILSRIGLYTDDNRSFLDFNKSLIPIITISGHFQDIKYHSKNKEILRKLFLKKLDFKKIPLFNCIDNNKINASLMLRLNNDRMVEENIEELLDKSYKIVKTFETSYNYLFFSDNQSKCLLAKHMFKKPFYARENDPLIQLYIASSSSLFIISPSSFAWWAYFLSEAKQKIVIKNRRWVLDDLDWNPGFFREDKVIEINE